MKRFFLSLYIVLSLAGSTHAQYTLSGKIEYERKTNVYATMKDYGEDEDGWFEKMKSQIPKFNIAFFDLVFDSSRSIYKPGREVENQPKSYWGTNPANDNIVLTDFRTQKVKAVKNVFEQKFMVQDSTRQMKWRVKDELRTIANYKCRKAVSVICDSVYVVAFYAEDIPSPAGPELFGGLPGMIMELAIPRLHTTWVATKIDLLVPAESDFKIPNKGKVVTEKTLYETIQSSLKDWGKWASKNVWWSII
ncbi:MAG: hypothetical protein JWQ38_623 [Flavipsychrobacter sp.]|nr:hypothetical protein [Flavipsychrobacter sp.]